MNDHLAERIADRMRKDGFDRCTKEDVWAVYRYGSVDESVIGEEYDTALSSRILQELDEYGVSP